MSLWRTGYQRAEIPRLLAYHCGIPRKVSPIVSRSPKPNSTSADVTAIVVSYFPDVRRLLELTAKLHAQGCRVIVVDNGSPRDAVRELLSQGGGDVHWVCLPENRGVGAAQNVGIRVARQSSTQYLAMFDQDSDPHAHLIQQLLLVAHAVESQGAKLAAVGACYFDARQQNPPPFIRASAGRLRRMRRKADEKYVAVDYVIASGSLIPVETINAVGLMDESLFIDYVDIEWGLRARAQGYLSYGAWDAKLNHHLGNEPVQIFGKAYPAREPIRYYYMFRNVWALLRKPYIPFAWKFVEAYRLVLRAVVWGGLAKGNRRQSIRAILNGTLDGLRGASGPVSNGKKLSENDVA